jgi:hypothetical protein
MKDASIQYIRVVAMIFIVVYHCICFYGVWDRNIVYDNIDVWRSVCYLALSAFVFISGLLSGVSYMIGKDKGTKTTLKNKFQRLLILYIIWGVLVTLLFTSEAYINDFFSGTQHLWFLLMLMTIFVVAEILSLNQHSIRLLLGGVILFILLRAMTAKYSISINYFAWQLVLNYMPSFICGIITAKISFGAIKLLQVYVLFALSTIAELVVVTNPSLPYGSFYIGIPSLIWLSTLYLLLSRVIVGRKRNQSQLIDSLDRHSMGIYIVHHILIWLLIVYIPGWETFMKGNYILAPIIMLGIVFPLSWLISSVIMRNRLTAVVFTGRLHK